MKSFIRSIVFGCMLGGASLCGMTSCTDYLDKAPESDIAADDAYKNFTNFQGFTEELYYCIPDFARGYWNNSWNWGEDEIISSGIDYMMGYKIDQGDFWGWQSEHDGWQSGFMDRNNSVASSDDRFAKSLWPLAWYGIRKANMGIQALREGKFINATSEERNLIEGQLYFFRGWFHFELIQYFGGLPYINEVLPADGQFRLPRPHYQAVADSIARDFRHAADLLPIDWDNTTAGRATLGKNQLRINKIMALGYLGKNYLWAGSPLMNYESQGVKEYNKDYCAKAAEAFGELLTLVESGQTQYALVDFDHYSDIFYTYGKNGLMPGSTEAIFRNPCYGHSGWNCSTFGVSKQFATYYLTDNGVGLFPTANYVNYYGMANGLPLDDPNSGFDPTHPWKGRDPRFYHDIRYDGCKLVAGTIPNASEEHYRYAELYSEGPLRDETNGSRTGYLNYKFISDDQNKYDEGWGWSPQFTLQVSWMRLSDIYLMYAESAAEAYGSAQGKSANCSLTAVQAVDKIRERAGVSDVAASYTGDLEKFMGEVRRERAVELSFEGHRFNDLRRWLLLDKEPYNIKTSQEFMRADKDHMNTDDPTQNAVTGWSEKQILKRNFTEKHYWLPLKLSDVNLYPEFNQNPGW